MCTMHRSTFSFEGRKHDGTQMKGTIEARNREEALARLQREYGLDVAMLSPAKSIFMNLGGSVSMFAAWLLGFLGCALALSFYVEHRILPRTFSFLHSLSTSPLLFNATLALFLFLLVAKIWEFFGKRTPALILCAILATTTFFLLKL